MTNRDRLHAVLHYQSYDRMPVVHFGFWAETLRKWADEGHLTAEQITGVSDGNERERAICAALGFDFNYQNMLHTQCGLCPGFKSEVVEELPDGARKVLNCYGMVVLQQDGAGSIPAEVDHLLKDRATWEEHYLPRLQFTAARVPAEVIGGLVAGPARENPLGLHCGSLFGEIRNWTGVAGISYIYADDEGLFREIIDTVGDLCYRCTEAALAVGNAFDFAHFWEDICFKNGPLVIPSVFAECVGPHYRRICDLVNQHGLDIVSLDCDGKIDALIPTWFTNGVNTMFPIEVGTWAASFAPWRETYGKGLRGVGGMDKRVFARDRAAVDIEVERLCRLVDLGGYVPCPDHRLAPDAQWELVQYYCERMHDAFT